MMQLGMAGKGLILSFEQLKLAAYLDQRGVWTCGWGHTGPDVGPDTTCTADEANAWFAADVHGAELAVLRTVDIAMTQNQFDALVSFTYNVGSGAEAHSTLLKLFNQGDVQGAAAEFPKWNHVNGVVDAGLTRRRLAEQALFLAA